MNPYETLGLEPDCTPEDIKRQYKRKAQVYHPDKEGGDAKMFDLVADAYETLVDPERRDRYDRFGDGGKIKKPDMETLLATIFTAMIDSGAYGGNLIDRCQDMVIMRSAENNKTLMGLNAKKLSLEGQVGRIEKEGGESLFDRILVQKILQQEKAIDQIERAQEELRMMNQGLNDYRDSQQQPIAKQGAGSTWYTTT